MPVIIHQTKIQEGPGYDIAVIDSGEQLWLGLVEFSAGGILRFWSTKQDEAKQIPYQEIIVELENRLVLVSQGQTSIDDALMFWPEGWDCWGGGVPMPISNYVRSGEFREKFPRWDD